MATATMEMETDTLECPSPGIYHDVPAETYFAWRAINNSGLKKFSRSPAHYLADLEKPEEGEEWEKNRGTICHCGLWEPVRFDAEYAIGPTVDLRTKAGKEEWQAFLAANTGKTCVRGADGAAMQGVRDAIWSHELAGKILASDGPTEVCIIWRDAATGLMCKARIDKISTTYSLLSDLKTTGDARPAAFYRQAERLNYFRQGAFYLMGAAAVGLPMEEVCFIAVETEPYHGLSLLVAEQDDILEAAEQNREAMNALAECRRTGKFPGYDPRPQPLKRPKSKWELARELAGVA